ncbi:hypothetical protein [Acinetobacter guillouiae]|uniref:hypothetical protein n=1 Tax=Acinetobacter guillouiae TaxID=106649 RepID=UPI0028E428F2|nr:hypothetical protein [Acinetobacter guillouiae]
MTEKTQIANPIEIKDNSKERIAFELMEKIANYERGSGAGLVSEVAAKQRSRDYWFKLYNQSYKVVNNKDIDIGELLRD